MATTHVPVPVEALLPAVLPYLQPYIDEAVEQRLAGTAAADPQYSVKRAAEYLDLDADTVRGYLDLPEGHAKRLKAVDTSGHARGLRIRLSELRAWQQRNDRDALARAAAPAPKRPARRRGQA